MTIEIRKENYYLAFWFCVIKEEVAEGGCDMMGAIYREPDGPWIIRYRFRYYKSDNPWDGKDEKHWYGFQAPDGSDEAATVAERTTKNIIEMNKDSFTAAYYLEVKGDGDDMLKIFSGDRPWVHKKVFKSEEEYQQWFNSMKGGKT